MIFIIFKINYFKILHASSRPLDYQVSDASLFGKAVSRGAAECGRWLTWIVAVDDVAFIETRLGRPAVDGHRTKPDDTDMRWKQIGVLATLEDRQLTFFIGIR